MINKNKTGIWITGASSGIGRAAAIEFAKVGTDVFISARRVMELERLERELKKENLNVNIYPCNVASAANVEQTVKKIVSEHSINCLINNAGITSFKKAQENSIYEIADIVNTNLLGSIYTIRNILPHMIKQGKGTIINLLSIVTKKVFTQSSAYAASKMGLLGYTNVLREEVRKYNIKVINIIPGAINTPMWSMKTRKEKAESMMSIEDMASLIVWLYLQKGNMVTEEIVVKPITGDL